MLSHPVAMHNLLPDLWEVILFFMSIMKCQHVLPSLARRVARI